MKRTLLVLLALASTLALHAGDIALPTPHKTGGMPLMEALAQRQSIREYDTRELSRQQLSDLVWATFGINRTDGRRTAPTANNRQEFDLYVVLKEGAYRYDAAANKLLLVTSEDIRDQIAGHRFAAAPVQLLYVADLSRRSETDENRKLLMAHIDCGYLSQNTGLFCASEGLATCPRASFNREIATEKLQLRPAQQILLAHSVGYPKP
jgi:nitroreductase